MAAPPGTRVSSTTLFFIPLLLLQSVSPDSTCGSLITYRQYDNIIASAPQCYTRGCGSNRLSSMSSPCERSAPCYTLYNILFQDYQKDWCDGCPDDVACRISGWPILNATAACDTSPDLWIFGPDGTCCSGSGEPNEVSHWISYICNGTYKSQFSNYDGMAKEDWHEWELPWNWTVQAKNTSFITVQQPSCPSTSHYLGIFAAENIVFFIFAFMLPLLRLLYIRAKQNERSVARRFSTQAGRVKTFFSARIEPFKRFYRKLRPRSDNSGQSTATVVLAIAFALFLTGCQVAVNFGIAFLIRYNPGYQDVPVALLALLFCARPRFTWFACIWSIFSREGWLELVFRLHTREAKLQGRVVVSSVAIGSSLSEVLMQLLGAYGMGKAAHVGATRHFYLVHRIRPFARGKDARLMYLGALFWLISSIVIVTLWLLVLVSGIYSTQFWETVKSYTNNVVAPQTPEARQTPLVSRLLGAQHPNRGKEVDKSKMPTEADSLLHDHIHRRSDGQNPATVDQGLVMRGGAAASTQSGHSSSMEAHAQVMRPRDIGNQYLPRARTGPYISLPSHDIDSMVMRPDQSASNTSAPSTGPSVEDEHVMAPHGTLPREHRMPDNPQGYYNAEHHLAYEHDHVLAAPNASHNSTTRRYGMRGGYELVPGTAYDGGRERELDATPEKVEEPPEDDPHHIYPRELQYWQTRIIIGGICFGLVSYIARKPCRHQHHDQANTLQNGFFGQVL